jgi:DNA modification methylase
VIQTGSITETTANKLASVDWNFANENGRAGIHTVHPYPARFIPQIPQALIRLFHPGDNSPVLDPFSGSATTLVEAIAAGHPAIGIDLSPLAILIARVKTTPLGRSIVPVAQQVAEQSHLVQAPIPDIPRLDHWFKPAVQQALANLIQQISCVEDSAVQDALKVALSRIIVRVSNQESDTRYAAIEKKITGEQVYRLFTESSRVIDSALAETYNGLFSRKPDCRLLNRNVLDVKPREIGQGIGLVITSPPYPNAYEYWLYHKYRMYWLGMDPIAVRTAEIGARPHYFKKNPHTEADFEQQMGRCFWLLARVMRPGSFACFLMGRSIIHGRHIDNGSLLERAALPHQFGMVARIQREILLTRKAFNPSHGKINDESIIVFQLGRS